MTKNLSNKKMDSTTLARIILICCILAADLIFLPWIVKFPFFLVGTGKDIAQAPTRWMSYGIFNSWKDVIFDPKFRTIVLFLQIPVATLILGIAWNVDRLRKKNRIKDGVGGPDPAGQGQHGTARWQNKDEMDKTATVWYSDTPINVGGSVLGMEKSRSGREKVWFNKEDLHTLLIAATRSGKSRKIFLPSIWTLAQAGESMVLGDVKGELYISSKPYLEKMGYKVIALNVREPMKGNQWNLLELVNRAVDENNIPKATEIAWDIANTIVHQKPQSSTEPIWVNGEESTIAALILLTALDSDFKFQRHMTTAYYLLAEYGQQVETENGSYVPLLEYIHALPVRHPAKAAFATASIAPYKTRASFFTTALADLRLFSDPNIADMTSKSDHELESIGVEKTAVFLIIPYEKNTRNVLATLYIDQLYQAMVDLANKRGGRIPRRLNLLLDEFGNLPPINGFDTKLTVAGGLGMRFTLAVQDFAQIKKLYKDNSPTITGNCATWIYLKTKDIETSKIISEQTGKYTVATENYSSTVQSKGHSSTAGEGLTGRSLLTDDEVRRWDIEESLVFPMSYFAARYPLPDLSYWGANDDYGFVYPTGDIVADQESNRKICEDRWAKVIARNIQESSIWLPEIITDEPEETEKPAKKKPVKKEEVSPDNSQIKSATEEKPKRASSKKKTNNAEGESKNKNSISEKAQPVTLGELNLDSILKAAAVKVENSVDDDNIL